MRNLGNVYGFTGNRHTGKRTLCQYRASKYGAVHLRLGINLQAATKGTYFLKDEDFTDERLHIHISDDLPYTPFELLRRTELGLKTFEKDSNFFLEQTLREIEHLINNGQSVWISNVCSDVEALALKSKFNATIIMLTRKGFDLDTHQEVSDKYVDYSLSNNGAIEELFRLSDDVVSWKKNAVYKEKVQLKFQVLNNAIEHLRCIAEELHRTQLVDDAKVSRRCYSLKDEKTMTVKNFQVVEHTALDEICKEFLGRVSNLIFTSRGIE